MSRDFPYKIELSVSGLKIIFFTQNFFNERSLNAAYRLRQRVRFELADAVNFKTFHRCRADRIRNLWAINWSILLSRNKVK